MVGMFKEKERTSMRVMDWMYLVRAQDLRLPSLTGIWGKVPVKTEGLLVIGGRLVSGKRRNLGGSSKVYNPVA